MGRQQVTKEAIRAAMAAAEESTGQDLRGMFPMACRTLATTVQVLRDELAWVEAERDKLRTTMQQVLTDAQAQDVLPEWWPMMESALMGHNV